MDATLEWIFNLYVFTTGRRLFALRQVRAIAKEQRFTELVKHCDTAVEHDLATRELERRWAGEPAATGANPPPSASTCSSTARSARSAITSSRRPRAPRPTIPSTRRSRRS